MGQLKLLLKSQLKRDFSWLVIDEKTNERKTKKQTAITIILTVLLGMLVSSSIISIMPIAMGIEFKGLDNLHGLLNFFQMYFCIFAVIIFVTRIIMSTFFNYDNEFLLSLPFKRSVVFLSKLLMNYFYICVFSLLVVILGLLPFGIITGLPIEFYLSLIIFIPIFPVFPMFFSTLLSFPIAQISIFLKKHRKFLIVLIFIFMLFTVGTYIGLALFSDTPAGSNDSTIVTQTVQADADSLVQMFSWYNFINPIFTIVLGKENVLMHIGIMLASCTVQLGLVYLLSHIFYIKMISNNLESRKEAIKNKHEHKINSPEKAHLMLDIKCILRSPAMILGVMSGLMRQTVFLIIYSWNLNIEGFFVIYLKVGVIASILIFEISLQILSLNCLGREGKSFFVSQTIPVPPEIQLKNKFIISYGFTLISFLPLVLIMVFLFKLAVCHIILMLLFAVIMGYGVTKSCMLEGIKNAVFDAENIQNNNQKLTFSKTFLNMICFVIATAFLLVVFIFLLPQDLSVVLSVIYLLLINIYAVIYTYKSKTKYDKLACEYYLDLES